MNLSGRWLWVLITAVGIVLASGCRDDGLDGSSKTLKVAQGLGDLGQGDGQLCLFRISGSGVSHVVLTLYIVDKGVARTVSQTISESSNPVAVEGMGAMVVQSGKPFDQPQRYLVRASANLPLLANQRTVREGQPAFEARNHSGSHHVNTGDVEAESETVLCASFFRVGEKYSGGGAIDSVADAKAHTSEHNTIVALLTIRWR